MATLVPWQPGQRSSASEIAPADRTKRLATYQHTARPAPIAAPATGARRPVQHRPDSVIQTKHVYIVDDDNDARAALELLLSRQPGLEVRCFDSGDAFLAWSAGLPRGVLLLASNLPGMHALDVLAQLHAAGERRFVRIVAGRGTIATAVQAMKAGADDFIATPYDAEKLLDMFDEAFDQQQQDDTAAVPAPRDCPRVAALSPRERDVLDGLIAGCSNKVIAYRLALSPRTIEIYRANLMTKLGVRNLPELLRVAFAAGIMPIA